MSCTGGDGITRTRMITLALLGVLAIGTVSASAAAGKSVAYLTGDSELQPVGTAVRLDFAIQLSSCEAAESELDEGTLASNAVKTDEIADIDARGKCAASYRGVKHQITGGVITMTLSASCNGPVHVRPGGQGPNRGRMPTGRVPFDGLRMVRWCPCLAVRYNVRVDTELFWAEQSQSFSVTRPGEYGEVTGDVAPRRCRSERRHAASGDHKSTGAGRRGTGAADLSRMCAPRKRACCGAVGDDLERESAGGGRRTRDRLGDRGNPRERNRSTVRPHHPFLDGRSHYH